ncbi:hypothetical protein Moror_10179 [Moniliophthora roreri MCA 2997]|uniref:Uncharacterized protein n=1 Tax=Moniliophthora roreri (strain MCA 2997) TaxID=1381753 RepID=V2WVZ5_MONRO|nr:hypothetical protein Moror_10179 [Moniliophthora roreri MCA 2997]
MALVEATLTVKSQLRDFDLAITTPYTTGGDAPQAAVRTSRGKWGTDDTPWRCSSRTASPYRWLLTLNGTCFVDYVRGYAVPSA